MSAHLCVNSTSELLEDKDIQGFIARASSEKNTGKRNETWTVGERAHSG